MIQFTLKCDQNHRFDSWFQSSAAFDKLKAAGMVTCDSCGSPNVEKALMAPALGATGKSGPGPTPAPADKTALAPNTDQEKALAALRKQVETHSDYVGMNFASQARAMHDGTAPERAIYGEAKPEEARKLIEDGVPVMPLPFIPAKKTN
ncbi:MAG: DUF1178 family protein [Paracoccaceae bacterium]